MSAVFIKILNMSITASWIVLASILIRFLLKKAPKWIMGILWGFVAFRLLFPFSLESTFSIFTNTEPIPQNIIIANAPTGNSALPILNETVNSFILKSADGETHILQTIVFFSSVIWIIGISVMLLYMALSYIRIHSKVQTAVKLKENIWICDYISTPFIFGVFRPRIYLPSSINNADTDFVLMHEKAHLKRKDHIWKLLGFLLLTMYWFNPILWVAYILFCKDIELACDEKVLRQAGTEIKKPYSNALINCSVSEKTISACPIAFGEVGVKERIKGILHYKKPKFWIILTAVTVCVIAGVCLLTNPISKHNLNGSNFSVSKYYYTSVIDLDKADRISADYILAFDENLNFYFSNGESDGYYRNTLQLKSDTKEIEKIIKEKLPLYYQIIGFDTIYTSSNDDGEVFAIMNNGDVIYAKISNYQNPQQWKISETAKLEYNGVFDFDI